MGAGPTGLCAAYRLTELGYTNWKLLEGTARAAEELLLGVAVLMIDRVAVLAAATQREASHAAWRRFERPRVNAAVRVRPFEVRGASLARCRWTRQQRAEKRCVAALKEAENSRAGV